MKGDTGKLQMLRYGSIPACHKTILESHMGPSLPTASVSHEAILKWWQHINRAVFSATECHHTEWLLNVHLAG